MAKGPSARPAAAGHRDADAFTALVIAHDAELLRFAFVVAGDADVARDAVQATWQRLWVAPPELRQPSRLRSWLLSVAANEARQIGRRHRRGAVLEQSSASPVPDPNPADAVGLLDLGPVLAGLPPEDRELLALRYVAELPSAQIAIHLGLTPEGARTRLHRLLARLRTELGDD